MKYRANHALFQGVTLLVKQTVIVCVMGEVAGLTLQDLYSIPMTPQDLLVALVAEVRHW